MGVASVPVPVAAWAVMRRTTCAGADAGAADTAAGAAGRTEGAITTRVTGASFNGVNEVSVGAGVAGAGVGGGLLGTNPAA